MCFRERYLEVFPGLWFERLTRPCADCDDKRRRPGIEALLSDGEADAAAYDDVDLLVAVRLAVPFDHRCSHRSGPTVDAERPRRQPPLRWSIKPDPPARPR